MAAFERVTRSPGRKLEIGTRWQEKHGVNTRFSAQASKFSGGLQINRWGKTLFPKAGNRSAELILLAPLEADIRWRLASFRKWQVLGEQWASPWSEGFTPGRGGLWLTEVWKSLLRELREEGTADNWFLQRCQNNSKSKVVHIHHLLLVELNVCMWKNANRPTFVTLWKTQVQVDQRPQLYIWNTSGLTSLGDKRTMS